MVRDPNTVFIYLFFHSVNKYILMSTLSQGSDFVDMAAKKIDKDVCSHGA